MMNQRKLGSIISYVQMALGVIVSLIYTPYMIKILGQSEYGLYNTVASTISMMSVLSLGFNSSYIRYYSRYKEEQDIDSIYKLNGLFVLIFSVIGMIALICGLYISGHLEIVFKDGLTASEYTLARKLLILLTINLAISFPMSVFADIISAHEQFIFLKLLGIVKTVCSPLLTIPLLFAGYRSVAIVTITIVLALFTDTMYLIFVIGHLKERFVFRGFKRGLFREIFTYTSFIAINIVVDQINWNIDKLLLARYKGTVAVAVYSVGYTLNNYYSMVSTAISGVFTPLVHRIINDTHSNLIVQRKQLTELFTRVGRVQFLILALVSSGLVFFGMPFIRFWAGEGYDDAYYVVLLLTLPATVPLIQNVGIEIQRAQNKHKFRSIVYLLMALVNLGVSIVFCQWWGAIGSALGTAISLVFANGVLINIYYQKKCNVDVISFWKSILKMFKGLIVPIVLGTLIMAFVKINSLVQLACWIVLYSVVYCINVWILSMNNYERELVAKPIKRLVQKISLLCAKGGEKIHMIQVMDKAKCVGCHACYNCCPLNCITMEDDNEGFMYPRVDQNVCINCKKCEKVCPVIQKPTLGSFSEASFAAYSKDEQIRKRSSSGGVFSVLAQIVLKHNGVVFGAAFDDEFQVHHIRVESVKDLEKLRGSKYVQSRIEKTFKDAKEILESGREVYFSGTPCQIDGFKNYLGREYDNLITQDIICHGVPAPLVWERYLDSVREGLNSEVKHVTFRDKALGWRKYSVKIEGANGTVEMSTFLENPMMKAYLRDMCLRPSCYNCPSKGVRRSSDLTLADFWNVSEFINDFDDNRGTDLVICHTAKGLELLNKARLEIACQEVDMRAAYENIPLNNSSKLPANRDDFVEFLSKSTFTEAVKKFCTIPMYERIITKIKLISKRISRRK